MKNARASVEVQARSGHGELQCKKDAWAIVNLIYIIFVKNLTTK